MLQKLLLVLLFAVSQVRAATPETKCANAEMARVETYLETAASIIDRLRENLPEAAASSDCSCPPKPMDCDEVFRCGNNKSGVFQVWPRNRIMLGSINVFCDMDTNGGGWTIIQRRGDFKRPKDFFRKTWHNYKTGFGDLRRDFWLGNDNIYALTNQKKYYLRIDLVDFDNNSRYAFYDQFWIDNESQNYKLHVHDFSGDAGDSLASALDGSMFSTVDRDNDNSTDHCAQKLTGGWWYKACTDPNINGLYHGPAVQSVDGVIWNTWRKNMESLQVTEIKIRSVDFQTDLLDMDVEPA